MMANCSGLNTKPCTTYKKDLILASLMVVNSSNLCPFVRIIVNLCCCLKR